VTGSPPRVTLTPDKTSYTDGDPIRVAVTVSDPDTGVDVIHGTDGLGLVIDQTTTRTDTATITQAGWKGSPNPLTIDGLTVAGVAQYGVTTLGVTVVDAQGNSVPAEVTVDVRSPMLIGSDRVGGPPTAAFPGMTFYRCYSGPGEGIKALPAARGLLYHMSFKDTPTAAALDAWFKALPTNLAVPAWQLPFDVLIEFGHECEGDRTATAQRAGVDLVKARAAAWNKDHPAGPRVGVIQTFTAYAQRHQNKTMTDGVPATIDNLWRQVDVLGVDVEKDTTAFPAGRPDHQQLMGWIPAKAATLKNAAGKTGVPYVLAEWAWMPPNDAELATWYTVGIAWLRKNGCAAVGVYDTNGSTANYVLSGPPLDAVKAAIATQ
jgi:hypothetical protein